MNTRKTKIVLDTDVIVHFAKGGKLPMLPRIFSEYQFMVLNIVKQEIPQLLLFELDRLIKKDKTVTEAMFGESAGEINKRVCPSD